MRTCGPIDRVRPDRRALADLARAGARCAVGSISARSGVERRAAARLRPRPDRRRSATACACASGARAPPERDLEPQPIAGHDLPAELRVVDAAQVDARVRRRALRARAAASPPPATATRASARRASAARREMPLEEFLVDRDVLDGDQPPARLVLDDRVHEQGRIAVAAAGRASMGMLMATGVRNPERARRRTGSPTRACTAQPRYTRTGAWHAPDRDVSPVRARAG